MVATVTETPRVEFDRLFQEITGINPNEAEVGADGFLFVPLSANIGEKPIEPRMRISALAGHNGWRNHLVDDEYAGWWIRRPAA